MLSVDALELNIEKKFKTYFNSYATVKGRRAGSVQNKTSFVSFCIKFDCCNKNIIQNKQEKEFVPGL